MEPGVECDRRRRGQLWHRLHRSRLAALSRFDRAVEELCRVHRVMELRRECRFVVHSNRVELRAGDRLVRWGLRPVMMERHRAGRICRWRD